jgi:hypothetical protein
MSSQVSDKTTNKTNQERNDEQDRVIRMGPNTLTNSKENTAPEDQPKPNLSPIL